MTAPFQPSPDPDGTIERIPIGGVTRFERLLSSRVDTVRSAITEPARLAGTPAPRCLGTGTCSPTVNGATWLAVSRPS